MGEISVQSVSIVCSGNHISGSVLKILAET